jgi:uncharacterized protein YajQ (UPF0234 family)
VKEEWKRKRKKKTNGNIKGEEIRVSGKLGGKHSTER